MKELTIDEAQAVNGGIQAATALGIAELWVGTVAGVGLAVVGAPVLASAAVGFALGGAFLTATSLI